MKRIYWISILSLFLAKGFGQVVSEHGAVCKAYAIACAQLANQSYTFSKLAYFVHKDQLADQDIDSSLLRIRQSIAAIDSALILADPACILAINYAQIARRYAVGSYKTLKKYQASTSRKKRAELAEYATLLSAKAVIDAYHSSFYFLDGNDTVSTEEPVAETEKKDSTSAPRVITKLDVDQALFALLDAELNQKLEEDKKKMNKLEAELKATKDPARVAKLKAEIKKLQQKEADLSTKNQSTHERLSQINTKIEERNKNKSASAQDEPTAFSKSHISDEWNKQVLVNTDLPMGLIYQVQIGIYKNPISPETFKGLTPVFANTGPQGITYSTGMFETMADAQQARDYVKSIGLGDAFIVAYHNQKKISTTEAQKLEKK